MESLHATVIGVTNLALHDASRKRKGARVIFLPELIVRFPRFVHSAALAPARNGITAMSRSAQGENATWIAMVT
jgi:hypothetical protein